MKESKRGKGRRLGRKSSMRKGVRPTFRIQARGLWKQRGGSEIEERATTSADIVLQSQILLGQIFTR